MALSLFAFRTRISFDRQKDSTKPKLTSENQGPGAQNHEDKVEERKGEERERGAKIKESRYLKTVTTPAT